MIVGYGDEGDEVGLVGYVEGDGFLVGGGVEVDGFCFGVVGYGCGGLGGGGEFGDGVVFEEVGGERYFGVVDVEVVED